MIDLITAAGLLLLGWGLWQVHPPIAFVVVGALLFGLGVYLLIPPRGQGRGPSARP